MMITGTKRELIMVDVFCTNTPLNLLQLFLETARRISETLEDTADGTHIAILTTHTVLIVAVRLTFLLTGHSGHKQLVGICRDGEAVILVDRYHQRCTQTHIGRQELTLVIAIERDLTTDVREVQTDSELTLTTAHHDVVVIVHRQVGSKG